MALIETVRRHNLQHISFFLPVVQKQLRPEELMQEERLEKLLFENNSLVSQPENSKY